ncbi:TetR/AcrR family transcriptional regulator [Sphingosinicella sp. BN140058]|uniref:TetR/AcrR family transcriptional regulator n=1 Tax=Sphingosinicella sp. BN140058 TaxID=1892855 RepID=UPI00101384BE|nr:TetR/AcrR family transcriptional regulator [Sphingosinicella sp. BN140058]QAY79458.1 TetR/AcrR family transcriptional regulator [Sphingosinicella sp. BN140058]
MPPRVKNAAATREAMLAAARQRFLQESYENVGLRDIARDVGVDVALVSRYFGSKEALFKDVLQAGKKADWLDPTVTAAQLPAYLASLSTEEDDADRRKHAEGLLIMLRSASSPKATEIIREALRESVLEPIARLLPGVDPEIRSSLALSVFFGTTVLRTIMAVGPLSGCDSNAVRRNMQRLLEAALADDSGA